MKQDYKTITVFSDIPQRPEVAQPDSTRFEKLDSMQIGFGSKVFRADRQGIWLGAEKFEDAPFSVSMDGDITATGISLSSLSGTLDDITDGTTHKKAVQNELTGGSRAYSGLNSSSEIIKGFLNTQLSSKSLPYNGVRVDSNGIYGRKSGSTTFYINSNGDATFSGDVISSTITSSTVTGSTLTTASSGSRVEIGTGLNQRVDFYIGSSFIGGIQSDNVSASNFISVFGGSNNHLNLNSGVYAEDVTLRGSSTVGIRAGTEVRSFADFVPGSNAYYDLGSTTRRWDKAYIDSRLFMFGTTSNRSFIYPNVANGSNLGTPTYYFYQMFANRVRYKDLASFDHIQDLEAIKNIKLKTVEVEGPDELNQKKKKYIKKQVWDFKTLPKDTKEGDFYDAGAVSGFLIGAVKELVTKVEGLESQLQELKNKVK